MLLGSLMGRVAARKGGRTIAVALAAALAACGEAVVERNDGWVAPVVVQGAEGRIVHNSGAEERWIPRYGVPERPIFLFSGVLAAARGPDGSQGVLPPAGDRMLIFDERGRFVSDGGKPNLIRVVSLAAVPRGWVVAERDGRVFAPTTLPFTVRAFPAPATIARFGEGLVAARSPFAVSLVPEPPGAPLLAELSMEGEVRALIDTIVRPSMPELATITNAGHIAGGDSLLLFAFLVADELRAYDASGRRRWTADRGFDWPRPPSVPPGGTAADVIYQPVNLGVTTSGGIVYLLSNASGRADSIRIDGFDAGTGVLRRTATLPAAPWLISTDADGALWYAPADTLATIGAPAEQRVVAIRLPTFDGDSVDTRAMRGKVVLLNFWASWCGPCRDEFPHMAALHRELGGDEFTVLAVSDDRDETAARRFLAEFDPPFPTAWARGSLEGEIGYRGLPFTLLLDREGRVVERYFGFGGARQFAEVRGDVERVLGR